MERALQRERVPGPSDEMNRNRALNSDETPSQPLVEDGQVVLGSSQEKCLEAAALMAAAAHEAARKSGFSFATVATVSGETPVTITRAFDIQDPPKTFRALAALLTLDDSNEWLRAACRLKGGQFTRNPKLTAEQKVERLEARLRLLGHIGEDLISEAYEG